jgi:hypothetical protein
MSNIYLLSIGAADSASCVAVYSAKARVGIAVDHLDTAISI